MIAIRVGVLAALLGVVPTSGLARQVVLEIDHSTGKATLNLPGKTARTLKFGEDAWVHPSDDIEVRVINTNTALYTYKLTQEKVPAAEIETLKQGLAGIQEYLTDLPMTFEVAPGPSVDSVAVFLNEISALLSGDGGVQDLYLKTITALEDMRKESVERVAIKFAATLRFNTENVPSLPHPRELARTLAGLRRSVAASDGVTTLKGKLKNASAQDKPALEGQIAALEKGQAILDKSEAILASAYAVERLAIATANAKSTWSSKKAGKDIDVTASEGRKIKITVAAKDVAELKRLADREPLEVDVKLNPDWPIQVSVGATLLMSQQSRFDRFATRARPDSTFDVVKAGAQDSRYTYGVSLGLTHRSLNWRRSGWALWPLVITVNPSDDIKAIGLGSAVSWRPLRLHAGWVFTKHAELDGSRLGDVQATDNVVTRDTYRDGKLFVGLGVSLWKVGD